MAAALEFDPHQDRGPLPDLRVRPRPLTLADATMRAQYRTLRHLWSTVNGQRAAKFHRNAMGAHDATPVHTAHAVLDELALVFFETLSDRMRPDEFVQLEDDVDRIIEQWQTRGFLDDPASAHADPPPPRLTHIEQATIGGEAGEWLRFRSGWQPIEGTPGGAEWQADERNEMVPVALYRHHDGPRPWLVLVHGAEMGRPRIDARLLKARHLSKRLGVNVAMPTLPRHGMRRAAGPTLRGSFPGENVVENIHGLFQSVWDLRRTIAWVRQQDATAIGVYGFSLGGGVSSLLGTLEPDLDAIVLGCPAVDLCDLLARNQPPRTAKNTRLGHLLARASLAHRPVSALHLDRRIDRSRVAIITASADRLADPVDQVGRLWHHWAQPEIRWIDGGHITYFLRQDSTDTLEELLRDRGVVMS